MAQKSSWQKLIESEQPILVDFHATWCGPCKAMTPIIEELAANYAGKAKIIKIDIDRNQKLANQLKIQGVPTFMLFKSGKNVWRKSGMQSAQTLNDVIGQHI